MTSTKLQDYTLSYCEVRQNTSWTFLEIKSESGFSGISEITMPGHSLNENLIGKISTVLDRLKKHKISSDNDLIIKLGNPENTFSACINSGIRNAFADLLAKEEGLPLNLYLSNISGISFDKKIKNEISLYANINRSMSRLKSGPVSRTGNSFAIATKRALKEGFKIIKCAPFDEINSSINENELDSFIKPGLERVSAIKKTLNFENKLLVDCHSRFNFKTALIAEKHLRSSGVSWFEEPLNPLENQSLMKELRKLIRLPLVGAEEAYGINTFENLFKNESLFSSFIISMQSSTHSSQIKTVGPAINFLTSCWLLPQKEQ